VRGGGELAFGSADLIFFGGPSQVRQGLETGHVIDVVAGAAQILAPVAKIAKLARAADLIGKAGNTADLVNATTVLVDGLQFGDRAKVEMGLFGAGMNAAQLLGGSRLLAQDSPAGAAAEWTARRTNQVAQTVETTESAATRGARQMASELAQGNLDRTAQRAIQQLLDPATPLSRKIEIDQQLSRRLDPRQQVQVRALWQGGVADEGPHTDLVGK
jgi:hypothetical protein